MFSVSGRWLEVRCHCGVWVGKKLGTDEHVAMREDGSVVRSRAIRETCQEIMRDDMNTLRGSPCGPLGVRRAAGRKAASAEWGRKNRRRNFGGRGLPGAASINIGGTGLLLKCKAVGAGYPAYETVGHCDRCRCRTEDLMQKAPELREQFERATEFGFDREKKKERSRASRASPTSR